jgi:polyferredoxin
MIKNYLYSLTLLSFTIFQGAAKAQVISTIAAPLMAMVIEALLLVLLLQGKLWIRPVICLSHCPIGTVVLKLSCSWYI